MYFARNYVVCQTATRQQLTIMLLISIVASFLLHFLLISVFLVYVETMFLYNVLFNTSIYINNWIADRLFAKQPASGATK